MMSKSKTLDIDYISDSSVNSQIGKFLSLLLERRFIVEIKLPVIQNYKHKIVRHEPSQSDFTSTCKILSHQIQQIFRLSHFVLILTFLYLYISILQVPFI